MAEAGMVKTGEAKNEIENERKKCLAMKTSINNMWRAARESK
jgi:hypothetical protein